MATRVLMAIFAMMLLTACNQAVPSSNSEDTASASGDTSNPGKADSPNNPGSDDSSDGTHDGVDGESDGTTDPTDGTVAVDGTDLIPDPPLDPCVEVRRELAPVYVFPSGGDLKFSMRSLENTCEITIHDGGYSYDGRKVYGSKLPLSFKGTVAEMRLECLVHDEDTGQAIEIVLYSVFTDTNELSGEITATIK